MKTLQSQRGVSYWAVMFGIILAVLLVKAAMAVWPVYWDDKIINDVIIERLSVSNSQTSPDEFKKQVAGQFTINSLRDIKFEDIAQVHADGGLIVETDYEVRRPFIANIDLVMSFKKRFDQKAIQSGE